MQDRTANTAPPPAPAVSLGIRGAGLALALAAIASGGAGIGLGHDGLVAWFLFAAGVGLFGLGHSGAREAWAFGGLFLTLVVGGAAQLWLTEPLWFPALRFRPQGALDFLMFGLVAIQGLTALGALIQGGALRKLGVFIKGFGPLRIAIFYTLSVLASVSVMAYLPRGFVNSYALHLVVSGIFIAINMATLAAMLCNPLPRNTNRALQPIFFAALAFAASAVLAWTAFEGIPHVEDEVIYLFQARTYADGGLTAVAPPEGVRAALDYYLMDIRDGRWIATPPPGWPAILSLGVLVGAPWLVNPLLAALSVLLAYAIARRVAGRDKAEIVALLLACSPWFLGASGSLMPHVSAFFLTLLCWWALLHSADKVKRALLWALLAGLAMGWVFVIRQLEGLLLGVLTGLWLLSKARQSGGIARLITYSLGCIASGLAFFGYNWALTGNPLMGPMVRYLNEQWHTGANAYGFGPDIGPPGGWGYLDLAPGHSPYEGLINTAHNLFYLNLEFLGWGIGSLALVWAALLWQKLSRVDWAMITIAATIIVSIFFYWFSGSFYIGPRYWFSVLFPVLMLSASGFVALDARLTRIGAAPRSARVAIAVLCIFGLLVFTPWRGVAKFRDYGGYTADVAQAAATGVFENALVFVETDGDIGAALMLNHPGLPDDRPIFLRDLGEAENANAIAAYPDRPVAYFKVPGIQNAAPAEN